MADAVVGAAYRQPTFVSGGERPLRYALADVAPALAWLRVDASTGELGGTPPAVVQPAQSFTLQVTDAKQRSARRTYTLAVDTCADGTTTACAYTDNTACMLGQQRCTNGQFGACSGGQGSTRVEQCGANGSSCGSCSTDANQCKDGRCKCGFNGACADSKAPTCCGVKDAASCTDTQTDVANCGGCGTDCRPLAPGQSQAVCTGGSCNFKCNAGYDFCPQVSTTRCIGVTADPDNCGSCGKRCPRSGELPNTVAPLAAVELCAGGSCNLHCAAGFANCNGDTADGCEAKVDVNHCGPDAERGFNDTTGCAVACTTSVPNAHPTCEQPAGSCGTACNAGAVTCGASCLICDQGPNQTGVGCDLSNGQPRCSLTCTPGYGNCDVTSTSGGEANGCETNLNSSQANCGSCGHACTTGDACREGRCCHTECHTECDYDRKPPCQETCSEICT
ncbi:hypothetical protein FGE12_06660 [Aggregicoccus sp. 17bor-14]|nr:hypothetical protein [Simulacricoccus sp. 17bor-14]MRI87848.1 hypothetical protein [Aggregicoccus sp. 17bor-14]